MAIGKYSDTGVACHGQSLNMYVMC
jgi:hypothetical protein